MRPAYRWTPAAEKLLQLLRERKRITSSEAAEVLGCGQHFAQVKLRWLRQRGMAYLVGSRETAVWCADTKTAAEAQLKKGDRMTEKKPAHGQRPAWKDEDADIGVDEETNAYVRKPLVHAVVKEWKPATLPAGAVRWVFDLAAQ